MCINIESAENKGRRGNNVRTPAGKMTRDKLFYGRLLYLSIALIAV